MTAKRTRRVGLLRRGQDGPGLVVERLIAELGGEGAEADSRRRALARQLTALGQVDADLDPALVLAVAVRESGTGVVSGERIRMHSFDAGGLDHLGVEMHDLLLPRGYGREWEAEMPGGLNHAGRERRAAWIPRDEAVVAYGAVLGRRQRIFERHVHEIFGERGVDMLASLSTDARRVFTQLAFGAQNGSDAGGVFGVRTALSVMAREIAAGRARDLNDVLGVASLREHTAMRRALVTLAEASLLDRLFGRGEPGTT